MAKDRDKTEHMPWTIDRELQLFRRVQRLIDEVPSPAWARTRDYLIDLLQGHRPVVVNERLLPERFTRDEAVGLAKSTVPAGDNDGWMGTGPIR